MSEPFIGEIRMFAGTFAPRGWEFCNGKLLSISENDALFSLFGTIYGGDGQVTFGLPDLRGRIPLHQGHGPGLSPRLLGSMGGSEEVTLTVAQLASHPHDFNGNTAAATESAAQGRMVADASANSIRMYANTDPTADFASVMIGISGGNQAHDNMMPTLCVNFIVSLYGIFPSRS
ncbi:microcystin-dependent protein [Hoeflea marina]|uniref:Microcystin-dependent protein n=1 Tax=Hoeflea marina TaxID=274592 RepID=A0A317PHI8_9HYPH|nr:tail fiber protein [Hoeflea marina]PWV98850.1 microcystin-dependent protein [Hoeflea marina]